MRFPPCHAWPRTPVAAIQLQKTLAERVRIVTIGRPPQLVAGADASFSPDGRSVIAGVVVVDAETGMVIEERVARRTCRFPYVPGLLSFRETPALLAAFRRLRATPDVVLCDAHGLAHPRLFGLACHLGLWLALPTIGCAKSRLCGEFDPPGPRRGDRTPLTLRGRRVGTVLRTRARVKPVYVSIGHLCDLPAAEEIVLHLAQPFRLPTPARLAHQLVTRARRLM